MSAKWTTRVRVILYTHCLVASGCIGLTVFALERRFVNDWRFDRQLELFLNNPAGTCFGWLCLLSSLLFPALVADQMAGRMSQWRRWVVLFEDICLGLVQLAALMVLIPVRY
jgi:hypothetical protein